MPPSNPGPVHSPTASSQQTDESHQISCRRSIGAKGIGDEFDSLRGGDGRRWLENCPDVWFLDDARIVTHDRHSIRESAESPESPTVVDMQEQRCDS